MGKFLNLCMKEGKRVQQHSTHLLISWLVFLCFSGNDPQKNKVRSGIIFLTTSVDLGIKIYNTAVCCFNINPFKSANQ